jgi:hypothetical protein
MFEDDLGRTGSRHRARRQSESGRVPDARLRTLAAFTPDDAVREAWAVYEARWECLDGAPAPLRFVDIPWPTAAGAWPTPDAVAVFVLAPAHSAELSRRDRLRAALLRWHPDRFGRVLARVAEEERETVDAAAGVVARCLNDLLAKESAASEVIAY